MLSVVAALVGSANAALPTGIEWVGVFDLAAAPCSSCTSATWSMEKVGGAYADLTMKMVFIPTPTADWDGAATTLLAGTCSVVEAGESLKPATSGSCYEFHTGTGDLSEFVIDTTGILGLVVYAQHFPVEFENTRHYFYTSASNGAEAGYIEPTAQTAPGGGGDGHDHGGGDGHDHGGGAADPHAGHDHGGGENPWEWAKCFATPVTDTAWSMEKVGGAYADPSMWLVMIPTSSPSASEPDAHKAQAMALTPDEGNTCTVVEDGETIAINAPECIEFHVDPSKSLSEFKMMLSAAGLVVYAQHGPVEFENTRHFFYKMPFTGEDDYLEPKVFTKRWGTAILAAFVVNLVTFSGIAFLTPGLSTILKNHPNAVGAVLNAFASGALLACAVFLMLPEGYLYVSVGAPSEGNTAFLFGTMILLGAVTGLVIDLLTAIVKGAMGSGSAAQVSPAKDGVVAAPADNGGFTKRQRVLGSVLLGDFMHNFVDGIFIGTGFSGCSNTLAWGIAIATVLHEIAQELADYVVLTDPKQGNLKPVMALLLNFVSGLSVVLGVIVIMAADIVDARLMGSLLVFGGAVYILVGLAECMPRVYIQAESIMLKMVSIVMFALGALLIGLILFNHEHCVPEGDTSHEGHDHGRRLQQMFDPLIDHFMH